MSDSDVDTIETMGPRLSDTDAEALIAGQPVAGVPPELSDMLSMMRDRVTTGPDVRLSAALCEFVEESVASVTPIRSKVSTAASPRTRSLARKAVAGFAIVPAKIFIGATMAAAAVGGAQALGVVDVPMLPRSGSQVVSSVPAETLPPRTPDASTVAPAPGSTETARAVASAPDSTKSATSGSAVSSPSTATLSQKVEEPVAVSPQTVPPRGPVDGDPGCEFGQEASGRRHGESDVDASADRSNSPAHATPPSIEPCDEGTSEDIPTSAPAETPAAPPVDRGRDAGAPPVVPGNGEEKSGRETPAPAKGNESGIAVGDGKGIPSDLDSEPEPEPEPQRGAGPIDSSSDGASIAEPPKNSERGRTPSGG